MTPVASDTVVNALPVNAAGRERQLLGIASHLDIDPPLGSVEVNLDHFPRRFQSQRAGEQGFDTNTDCSFLRLKRRSLRWMGASQGVCMVIAMKCHVDGHAPAYWRCTASRVRFAGLRFAQPALDPVPSLSASILRATLSTGHLDT